MSDNKKILKKPSKKVLIAVVITAAAAVCIVFAPALMGNKSVSFEILDKKDIPQSIETDVVPEYRDLERALGCLIDGKVYVLVTRGEKPTAGYEVTIEEMVTEKTSKGTNLQVHALFKDPEEGESVAQVSTYPYAVALTNLKALPETIELLVKYQ